MPRNDEAPAVAAAGASTTQGIVADVANNSVPSEIERALDRLYPSSWALLLTPICGREQHRHGRKTCAHPGKRPIGGGWQRKAVERWRAGRRRAEHISSMAQHLAKGGNVGLVVPPGAVVLDADTTQSVRAGEALLDDAPIQRTTKGAHFVARVPASASIKATVKLDLGGGVEVDVRSAARSQIVVEPSIHASGTVYSWIRELPERVEDLVECPGSILEKILSKPAPKATPKSDGDAILEGRRNATLMSLAGSMRRRGMTEDSIRAALLAENAAQCRPPLPDAEVRAIAASVSKYEPAVEDDDDAASSDRGSRKSAASRLVEIGSEAELWHTPDGVAHATVGMEGHFETHAIGGTSYRRWIVRRYYGETRQAPTPEAVRQALGVLDARALYDGAERDVHLRVAPVPGGGLVLDLGDAAWRSVVVDASGWRVVERPPVRMRRAAGMLALPVPERGGSLAELADVLGLGDETVRVLCAGWILAALRPAGPYPVLILHGEQGSGKSTLARMLRRLIDPSKADLRAQPREDRDVAIATNNAWCLAIDNVSTLPTWISDGLCRISTGGGFSTRTLYSDTDETILDAMRPVLLTGIDLVASRGDLLDRALTVTLPRPSKYIPEEDLWERYYAARPRMLGALLDAVALAVAREPETEIPGDLRMVDAARWVAAAEPACPWPAGAWIATYTGARAEGWRSEVEASAVASAIVRVVDVAPWEGTAAELLTRLSEVAGERATKDRSWPRSPRALGAELRRLAPALRGLGIEAAMRRAPGGARRRLWRVATIDPQRGEILRPDRLDRPDPCDFKGLRRDANGDEPSRERPLASRDGAPRDANEGEGRKSGDDRPAVSVRPAYDRDDRDDRDARTPPFEAEVVPEEPADWWESEL